LAGTGSEARRDAITASGPHGEALLRVLTPENRRLLALIDRYNPESVGALSRLAARAQPNVSRALASLEAVGVVKMVGARPKRPELAVRVVVIDLAGQPGN
jgi:predicted transcriptional regulator